ncbi:hypothetical protein [Exiguobacterium antarcticum]|uniref:hypothetical protein n=1 Tax=Exiguobacterium antarcticum TaxID=132920 RepID=UPI000A8822BB|nr:hypothetical protein [Exiguobacterium antarcticum]
MPKGRDGTEGDEWGRTIEVVLEDDRATEAFKTAFAGRLEKGMILLPSEGRKR